MFASPKGFAHICMVAYSNAQTLLCICSQQWQMLIGKAKWKYSGVA